MKICEELSNRSNIFRHNVGAYPFRMATTGGNTEKFADRDLSYGIRIPLVLRNRKHTFILPAGMTKSDVIQSASFMP